MKKLLVILLIAALLLPAAGLSDGLHKLSAPKALGWGPYYEDGVLAMEYPGMIAFQATDAEYKHKIKVKVYKKGPAGDEEVFSNGWTYRPGDENCMSDWDFINNGKDLESGDYYYVLQAIGDGETTADSDKVTSDVWTYVRPEKQLEPPANLRWDGLTARWDKPADALVGGYTFSLYYAEDNAAATSHDEVKRLWGFLWYFRTDSMNNWFELEEDAFETPGYYYFTVESVSANMTQGIHSEHSPLSAAYHKE